MKTYDILGGEMKRDLPALKYVYIRRFYYPEDNDGDLKYLACEENLEKLAEPDEEIVVGLYQLIGLMKVSTTVHTRAIPLEEPTLPEE